MRDADLPPDWIERGMATDALIARLGAPTNLDDRRALARAYRDKVELAVWAAGLRLQSGAPEAERAFERLEAVRAGDPDPELRRAACEALLWLGHARRTQPGDKIAHELSAVEQAHVLAAQPPALHDVVVAALVRFVKSGQFQAGPRRARALRIGKLALEQYLPSEDTQLAAPVAELVRELTAMMHPDSAESLAVYDQVWAAYAVRGPVFQRHAVALHLRRVKLTRKRERAVAIAYCERIATLAGATDPELAQLIAEAAALRTELG